MTKEQYEVFQKFNSIFFANHAYLFPNRGHDVFLQEYLKYFRDKNCLNILFSPMVYSIEALRKYADRIVITSYYPLQNGAKQIFTLIQHSPDFHTLCNHTVDEDDNFIFCPEFFYKDISDCQGFIKDNMGFEAPIQDKKIGLHAGFASR